MLKVGLSAFVALSLTAASAQALDNSGADRAAVSFELYGVQGLALAGRAPADVLPIGQTDAGFATGASADVYGGGSAHRPVCWTQYLTAANANTLVNMARTICR